MLVGQPTSSLIGKDWTITKAVIQLDGTATIEGWISTNIKDMEKDILEPEAFMGAALPSYMQRGAPISSEHNTKSYPVGYLLKAALVRNGKILQLEDNPRYDKTEFLDFDALGTGWYGMGTIYEPEAVNNVKKGTVRSFSWIGKPNTWEDLPDGGKHFSKSGAINPLLETTITAYPINMSAIMRIAKAYNIDLEDQTPPASPDVETRLSTPGKTVYSIPTQALIDLVMGSKHVREMNHSAVERAFEKKGK